jgi:hypothetical protein
MHLLFSANQQSENPCPAFFFDTNFYSSLINMPIIQIEEFETSLLTLFGVSLVLWRRKTDSALSNPCFMALPPNFTTSEFPISNYFTFKIFVRSCRDWKKKWQEGSQHTQTDYFNKKIVCSY